MESQKLHSCFIIFVIIFSLSLKDCTAWNPFKIFKKHKTRQPLPVQSIFKLPSPPPPWPSGQGFANGTIDLGGLLVSQISSFSKVWAALEGGPDNRGATFYEPSLIPEGFFMLGSYSQPNNRPLFGWVLVAKDVTNNASQGALALPTNYTLVWSSESRDIKQDGVGYIWLPTPPQGYNPIGHVVTNSSERPPLDMIRCVRSDLTALIEIEGLIWRPDNGLNVYTSRPAARGSNDSSVPAGTFVVQTDGVALSLSCLKNVRNSLSAMPNVSQIQELVRAYSPMLYFHPDEQFLPSSVSWFFQNGALLYTKGNESNPVAIDPTGSNLPLNGTDDGAYWLDLPINQTIRDSLKKGNLQNAEAYLHVKPRLGATFTDIVVWIFYPFNGAAKAKVEVFHNVRLGKIGEHVGDWEHVTLRISNFDGELKTVYFSQHNSGTWVSSSDLEFGNGSKPIVYVSLHGHAAFPHPGLVLEGTDEVGIRNDMAKGDSVMDAGATFSVVNAEYLGTSTIVEPSWLNYAGQWGPNVTYDIDTELTSVMELLPGDLESEFKKILKDIPHEVLGEEGPVGPKMKDNWNGDERV
ncbi:hypothetical protein At1g04090 [Daucus carota subsp. sativus]|uniref:hypothetical protein At1g04090 n=1 Tax=Daucus carota subsp. sativus TaxID=79200 RepID=UPI0007EF6DEF|nr:PREDICTED: uncharacterized protein LOC108216468 [Daucus carota subsp. sativus]